jgi:hypothetical protein
VSGRNSMVVVFERPSESVAVSLTSKKFSAGFVE